MQNLIREVHVLESRTDGVHNADLQELPRVLLSHGAAELRCVCVDERARGKLQKNIIALRDRLSALLCHESVSLNRQPIVRKSPVEVGAAVSLNAERLLDRSVLLRFIGDYCMKGARDLARDPAPQWWDMAVSATTELIQRKRQMEQREISAEERALLVSSQATEVAFGILLQQFSRLPHISDKFRMLEGDGKNSFLRAVRHEWQLHSTHANPFSSTLCRAGVESVEEYDAVLEQESGILTAFDVTCHPNAAENKLQREYMLPSMHARSAVAVVLAIERGEKSLQSIGDKFLLTLPILSHTSGIGAHLFVACGMGSANEYTGLIRASAANNAPKREWR